MISRPCTCCITQAAWADGALNEAIFSLLFFEELPDGRFIDRQALGVQLQLDFGRALTLVFHGQDLGGTGVQSAAGPVEATLATELGLGLEQLARGGIGLKGYDLDGGSYSVTTLMTGVRYSIPFEGKSAFYLQGGVGIAFSSLKDIEMAGYTIIKGDSSTDLALMAGTGWEYRVNRNETLFVELRYVNVLNEGPNLAFFPLRIGATFKF